MTGVAQIDVPSFDRKRPGLIIVLVDQSGSMMGPLAGHHGGSKAQIVADAVNELLEILVRRCTKDIGAAPRHYYDISVIGYGGRGAIPLLGGRDARRPLVSITEAVDLILRVEVRNGMRMPVWIDPVASGDTPMCAAMDTAGSIASTWIEAHPDSYPPTVFNVTDGVPSDEARPREMETWAARLRGLHTARGNLLLFTLHVSSNVDRSIRFPSSEAELSDDALIRMFRVSSELPQFMRLRTSRIESGAKGLVCNASIEEIVFAFELGTSLSMNSYS